MNRIWDYVIYILIGLLVAAGAYWAAVQNVSEQSVVKWGGLTLFTLVLFGWVIKQSRRFWNKRIFWWTIASFLVVHVASFLALLAYFEHWRMVWFFVICTLEVIPISAGLDRIMGRYSNRRRSHPAN